MKILVFGNVLVNEDALPIKLMSDLKKEFPEIEFMEFDPAENLENEGRNLIILDTVVGIGKVSVLEDLDQLKLENIYSMHDFDLSITLKLLKKMEMLESVKIIGIPPNYDRKKALDEVKKIIRSSLLLKSG